jgi:hypothetical protein
VALGAIDFSLVLALSLAAVLVAGYTRSVLLDWAKGGRPDPDRRWGFSPAAWRATRRSSLPGLIASLGLLVILLDGAVLSDGPAFDLIGLIGALLFFGGLLLSGTLAFYASPKTLVPPKLRSYPGYSDEPQSAKESPKRG